MASLNILRYKTEQPPARGKITLQQNLLTFLLEGEKTIHFAGSAVDIRPHQFVMLAAGNCLMTEKLALKHASYHSILIFFDNTLLTDFFSRHADLLGENPKPTDPHPFLVFEKDEFLINFIRSLDLMLIDNKPIHEELRKIKLEELLLYLGVRYPGQIGQIANMTSQADEELAIRQVVTAHIDNNITVEELAFLCNMSLSSFKRKFAGIYATSPNKWFLEKRMERAARMLRNDQRKPSEIFYELGYENLSSFIQSFKQIYGVTPKQYQLSN